MEGNTDRVRHNTTPYEALGITEIADHYERIIGELDKPPIIMGHSFGGLITQILLDRGLGSAGDALTSPEPPRVAPLPPAALRARKSRLANQLDPPPTLRPTLWPFVNTSAREES